MKREMRLLSLVIGCPRFMWPANLVPRTTAIHAYPMECFAMRALKVARSTWIAWVMLGEMLLQTRTSSNLVAQDRMSFDSEIRLAWELNQKKLGNLDTTFEKVIETPGSDKAPVIYDVKFSTHEKRVVMKQLRADISQPLSEYYFDGKNWTEYKEAQLAVVVRTPDQMPGVYPFDFREAFMHDIKARFADYVSGMQFSEIKEEKASFIIATFAEKDGTTLRVKFDPRTAMLPIASGHSISEDRPLRRVEMQYEYVQGRDAYIPSKIIANLYGSPDFTAPKSTTTFQLKSLLLKEPSSDIKPVYAEKSRIYDLTSDKYRTNQQK